ncbi:hypothetical protein NEHOM01_0099 [Nematocida homosporus]|uniref:uncharacterized protein n=1 Tax=Nematocida homosporus TaxID=1912981 RepID=UPI0022206B3A|nr:uncharacterized protein NEHOM01_0099 [Nematocida homosporus]KAI5184354.1 hypothetical protein NEHOM01_0099 [Nematocida homosporus]
MTQESSEEDQLVLEEKKCAEKYVASLASYENSLALDRPSSIWAILKVPGIVFFAGVGGYLLGWLKFQPWVLVPLLYTIGFVFVRRIKEFKRGLEAFIYFSIRKQSVSKFEKVDWLNEVMEKSWRYVESTASRILLLRVSAILRHIKVPMINDIRLDRFTLGGQPPVIEGIRIRKSDKESLIVDVALHFIPAVMENQQNIFEMAGIEGRETDWNSNITLIVRVGGAAAGLDIPLTLKNVSFRGSARIKLNLTYNTNVVEGVEFSFLKQPVVSFNIVPLKMVDIMDIPGLATAIKKVIELGIEKEALYPKRISVALHPKSVYYVGVIGIHIHQVVSNIVGAYYIGVGVNGRKNQCIARSVGSDRCNFIAYIPIKNMDEFISINIQKQEEGAPVCRATIPIDRSCMQSRTQMFVSLTSQAGYIDLSTIYIPKFDVVKVNEEEKPRSAIVTVKLAQLIDIVDQLGHPYKNLHAKATVYLKEKKQRRKDPASMSAAELMIPEGKSPAPSATNESSTDSDEADLKTKEETVLTDEVLGMFTTKTSRDVISPAFDENFVFFTRDTKRTVIVVEAYEGTKQLGSFSVNIRRGISISYGTFDFWHLQAARAKLLFAAEYVCMNKIKMPKYTHIRRITIEEIGHPGAYTGYIVTSGRVVPIKGIYSHGTGQHHATILVPILSTDELSKFVAYHQDELFGGCDVITGETFLGETPIRLTVTEYPLHECKEFASKIKIPTTETSPLSSPDSANEPEPEPEPILHSQPDAITDNSTDATDGNDANTDTTDANTNTTDDTADTGTNAVDVNTTTETTATTNASPTDTTPNITSPFTQMRVIVCRVDHPIFLEFSKDDVVLDRSSPSTGKKLFGEFFFFTDVNVSVYTVKEGFLIGKFVLAKSNGRHEIKLAHNQLFVIDLYNRWFPSYSTLPINRGTLTLTIPTMTALDLPEIEIYHSVFLELSVKDTQYSTKPTIQLESPAFTESFTFNVFTPLDILYIQVWTWTLLKEKKSIGEISLPLYAIPPGQSNLSLIAEILYIDTKKSTYKLNSLLTLA